MLELFGGGIIGSLLGGLFRLAPEVLKFFDKKNERLHELKMFEQQCQLENMRAQNRLQEIGALKEMAVDVGVIGALKSAIDQQAEMVKAAGSWVASLSASVRPVITYWVFGVWTGIHVFLCVQGYNEGMSTREMTTMFLSVDFVALVSGTLNYWFLDRTLQRRGL